MSPPRSSTPPPARDQLARLRFAVIGPLLASPAEPGKLLDSLKLLAGRDWQHPITSLPTRFGVSTIERRYYHARRKRLRRCVEAQFARRCRALTRFESLEYSSSPSPSRTIIAASTPSSATPRWRFIWPPSRSADPRPTARPWPGSCASGSDTSSAERCPSCTGWCAPAARPCPCGWAITGGRHRR